MKSFGFSQNPPFIDCRFLHIEIETKLQYYKSESNLAKLLVNLFVEFCFRTSELVKKLFKALYGFGTEICFNYSRNQHESEKPEL